MGISPWDVIDTWPIEQRIGFYRGSLLKYNMRLDAKDSRSDNAGKAAHLAQKLHEVLSEAVSDICPITSQACHDTPCPTAIDCSDRVPVEWSWRPWAGGDCPVLGQVVDVCYRDGRHLTGMPADTFCWDHSGSPYDIMKYRVVW